MKKDNNKIPLATEIIKTLQDKIYFYRIVTSILILTIILLFIIKS